MVLYDLTIAIEEPSPDALFLRFIYEAESEVAGEGGLDEVTVALRQQAETELAALDQAIACVERHLALAELENKGKLQTLVTQNIDSLHIKAGNSLARIIEVHGTVRDFVCMGCGERGPIERVLGDRAFLAALDGSCRTPLAGHATLKDGRISFRGEALTHDGAHCFATMRDGGVSDAARMGHEAGEEVKARGGALIAY